MAPVRRLMRAERYRVLIQVTTSDTIESTEAVARMMPGTARPYSP
jgi:hypothetical protein